MWNRVREWVKAGRRPRRIVAPAGFGLPVRPAGWWRDDTVEQLRNYQSWVYAAVNAIAQLMFVQAYPFCPALRVVLGNKRHKKLNNSMRVPRWQSEIT